MWTNTKHSQKEILDVFFTQCSRYREDSDHSSATVLIHYLETGHSRSKFQQKI